jgi:hypothetical protein
MSLRGSFEVPRKAGRIFKDYVLDLYYPANQLPWPDRLRYAPLLFLVEYLIYRVDAVAERAKKIDLAIARNRDYGTLHRYKARLEAVLKRMDAYNELVALQLEMGEQYVRLENKITSTGAVDHRDAMRLAELRPSDVRLLHSMIFAVRHLPCNNALVDLLWPVEVLADLGNDLVDYQEDVTTGRYNTYAMFTKLYGREAPARIRTEIAHYERLFLNQLARFPRGRRLELEVLCARRYRDRTAVIPEVIL